MENITAIFLQFNALFTAHLPHTNAIPCPYRRAVEIRVLFVTVPTRAPSVDWSSPCGPPRPSTAAAMTAP